jgi:hypothetical protein
MPSPGAGLPCGRTLHALSGPGARGGGQALVAVCTAHGLDDAVGVLDAWLEARD